MPGEPEPGPGIDLRRLPWPAVWARPSRAPVLALVVLLGLVLAITPFVALTELREQGLDPRAGMLLATSPIILIVLVLLIRTRLLVRRASAAAIRATRPGEMPEPGLLLPARAELMALRTLGAACFLLLGGAVVVGGIGLLLRGTPTNGGIGVLLGIALVVAGSLPLRAGARGRGGTTGLLLTPAGLVHRTAGIERVVRWSEVLGVTATAADAPAALVGVSRVAAPNGQAGALDRRVAPDLIIRLGDLAVDPVLGLEILRFYASHPRLRAELGTGADVRRVRRLDLPTN